MDHTQYIQQLITERNYRSYLEIGYGQGHNFNAIEARERTAVDPNLMGKNPTAGEAFFGFTSDEYFAQVVHNKKWDLIFVDGSHLADQVERDIVNAWKHLKKGGCIVLHDVWPSNERMTRIPRETKAWCGTVFQAWDGLATKYTNLFGAEEPHLEITMYTDDYGIGIIEYSADIKIEPGFVSNITFDEYKAKYFA